MSLASAPGITRPRSSARERKARPSIPPYVSPPILDSDQEGASVTAGQGNLTSSKRYPLVYDFPIKMAFRTTSTSDRSGFRLGTRARPKIEDSRYAACFLASKACVRVAWQCRGVHFELRRKPGEAIFLVNRMVAFQGIRDRFPSVVLNLREPPPILRASIGISRRLFLPSIFCVL